MTDEPIQQGDGRQGYHNYSDVPWYRRSGVNSLFIIAHLLTCGFVPLLLWVCINLVTGDVYYDKRKKNGELRVWSVGNKVVAVVILAINVIALAMVLSGGIMSVLYPAK
jgi:hypothetical protein